MEEDEIVKSIDEKVLKAISLIIYNLDVEDLEGLDRDEDLAVSKTYSLINERLKHTLTEEEKEYWKANMKDKYGGLINFI